MSARYETEVLRHWGGQPDGAHDLGHLRRVWANCQRIAAREPADLQVLEAAAFFHDLVNLPKSSPDRARASTLSAQAACTWLAANGFPPAKLKSVAHAIAAHSFSAGITPLTLEAKILQDADRLEALGAIGIARMFHVAGTMGALLFDAEDPLAHDRALDDQHFSLDHLQTKLFTLPATMQTATGRKLAEERAAWMLSFRDRLLDEIQ
ncbi:MAG: HD domain-containing protein [Cypionkella sp.]